MRNKKPNSFTKVVMVFKRNVAALFRRRVAANLLMLSFILFTSVGAALISPEIGFIVAGATCGLFGFLLGLE